MASTAWVAAKLASDSVLGMAEARPEVRVSTTDWLRPGSVSSASSVAEAAALATAVMAVQAEPVQAQLLTPRCTSPDRLATAAIAFSENIRP